MTGSFRKSFPYPMPRPQQLSIMDTLDENWSKYDYFMISAPCGVGKSGIAHAVATSVRMAFLLTSTKMLQEQYLQEFSKFRDLRGMGNYTCSLNKSFTVDTSPCTSTQDQVSKCISGKICPYYNDRDAALRAQVYLTSYAFFQSSVECGILSKQDYMLENYGYDGTRDVIIYDEAHELERNLVEFGSTLLDPIYLRDQMGVPLREGIRFRPTDTIQDTNDLVAEIKVDIHMKKEQLKEQIEEAKKNATEWFGGDISRVSPHAARQLKQVRDDYGKLDRLNQRMKIYLQNLDDEWIIEPKELGRRLEIKPVYAKRIFKEYIGSMASKHVFMSATLGDPNVLAHELGIDRSEVCFIEVNTPFSPEKSPIYPLGAIDLSYRNFQSNVKTMVDMVEMILDEHPNDKGIIHAGNYSATKAILEESSPSVRSRLIGKTGGDGDRNDDLVKRHKESKQPTVLVSPSMYTGVDLKEEHSRFQIVVKLPFAQLTDSRIKRKMELDPDWYSNQTILKLIQGFCRSTRTEEDWSDTYILDRAFTSLFNRNQPMFPEWIKTRLVWE